jgi:dynein heavy chain
MENGFFEFKNLTFCQVVDTVAIASMGIPGGGKTHISKRLTRRFNLVHIPDFSDENL